jgi:hypothetical protein
MSTFEGLTPQALELRTDRRTKGSLKCNPPNRRCGDRCIPPSWDCRLKGEGNDSHLKAAGNGSDPIAGFANIERGISRLGKGALKLSFSEVEGGRRALARGVAKLAPGDLQRKKELQETVYRYGVAVGAPVALVIFGGLSHRGLKSFKGYREGPGRQIDEAAASAMRTVARNMPFGVGTNYRAREALGINAVRNQARVTRNLATGDPAVLTARAGSSSFLRRTAAGQSTSAGNADGTYAIVQSFRSVDTVGGKPSKRGFTEWEERSLQAFWSTPRGKSMGPDWIPYGEGTSVFSVTATNKLLSRSFGFTEKPSLPLNTQTHDIVVNLTGRLRDTSQAIRTSMQQAGLNPASPEDVARYVRSVPLERGMPPEARQRMYDLLEAATTNTNHATQAREFYRATLQGYDRFFRDVSTRVVDQPSIRMPQDERERTFWRDGSLAHADALARRMGFDAGSLDGMGVATVIKKAYHASHVRTNKRLFKTSVELTPIEAMTAASEVARSQGRVEPDTAQEAVSFLNNTFGGGSADNPNRLRGITLLRSQPRAAAPAEPPLYGPPLPPRTARRRSEAQRLADIRRERNPDGSPRFATPEAALAELRRRQGRTDATMRARLDYTAPNDRLGKPCGKSFVAKQRKCSKPTSRRYADKPQAAPGAAPRGRRTYPAGYIPNQIKRSHTVSKETSKKVETIAERAAKVAAVAGAVAGGVALYRNRGRVGASIKRANPELYKQASVRTRLARKGVRQLHKRFESAHLDTTAKAINALSSTQVRQGLERIPEEYRGSAKDLIGRAKVGMSAFLMYARGSKLVNVDTKNNHSTFKLRNGDTVSVGSVGDAMVMFRTHPEKGIDFGGGQVVDRNVVDFTVDLQHGKTTTLERSQSLGVVRSVKTMFKEQLKSMPDESFVTAEAYGKDDFGDKRKSIYEKFGFTSIGEDDSVHLWALKTKGTFKKLNKRQIYSIKTALRSNSVRGDKSSRYDKRCGKSGISSHEKCTKPTSATETAGRIAATAGILALPVLLHSKELKRHVNRARTAASMGGNVPHPPGKSKTEWMEMPRMPGAHEGHRQRHYAANLKIKPVSSSEFADKIETIAFNRRVADLVRKHDIKIDSNLMETIVNSPDTPAIVKPGWEAFKKQLETNPMGEGFHADPAVVGEFTKNTIYINHRRIDPNKWEPNSKDYINATVSYESAREHSPKTQAELQANPSPETMRDYLDSFTTYGMAKGDTRDLMLATHELGHALDIGVGRRRRPDFVYKSGTDKKLPLDHTELFRQSRKVMSHYGLSDMESTGDEFVAESFNLYMHNATFLRIKAPLLYDWMDTYVRELEAM